MKLYNNIFKNLCQLMDFTFIDNQGSFVLTAGQLPTFHADKVDRIQDSCTQHK